MAAWQHPKHVPHTETPDPAAQRRSRLPGRQAQRGLHRYLASRTCWPPGSENVAGLQNQDYQQDIRACLWEQGPARPLEVTNHAVTNHAVTNHEVTNHASLPGFAASPGSELPGRGGTEHGAVPPAPPTLSPPTPRSDPLTPNLGPAHIAGTGSQGLGHLGHVALGRLGEDEQLGRLHPVELQLQGLLVWVLRVWPRISLRTL